MRLYHGTSPAAALRIAREGLRPRAAGDGNWEDHPSREDAVYLTNAYAFFFADVATAKQVEADLYDEAVAVVEVDVDAANLRPDEDYLEQSGRVHEDGVEGDMGVRTKWYRDRLDDFAWAWRDSLDHLGNASHVGAIPAERVRRIALIANPAARTLRALVGDPTITLLNYYLMGSVYRASLRWIFDEGATVDDLLPFEIDDRRRDYVRERLENREGITIFEPEREK